MQVAASSLTDRFAEVLARLPEDLDLDGLAIGAKAIQRRREVVDGAGLLRIALARGPGGLSLRQTSAWASMQGIAELSNPGVKYRLDQATAFLAAVVEHLLVRAARPRRTRVAIRLIADSRSDRTVCPPGWSIAARSSPTA